MNEYFSYGTLINLGEAIQEFRALENDGDIMSAEITHIFEQHDAIHVLFNCGTSIEDEIAVHIWMIFATTAKINQMHRVVANREHRNVLSVIGHLKLIRVWFTSLPRIVGIISKSLRMKKKLAVEELSQLKEKSIIEIRREHGIIL